MQDKQWFAKHTKNSVDFANHFFIASKSQPFCRCAMQFPFYHFYYYRGRQY